MQNLLLEATRYTPKIDLNFQTGELSFEGKSYPENTFEFYQSTMDWVEEYLKSTENEKSIINFEIIYFNSSSSKFFFDLLDLVEEAHNQGKKIEINWIYDAQNDSALEAGEDFKDDFENLSFNLVQK